MERNVAEMVIFLSLAVVGLTVLLMPDVFVALGEGMVASPGVGATLVAVLGLILVWIYRR